MAQWIRIRLPMQGTWVWTLAWVDSICLGAGFRALEAQLLSLCDAMSAAPAPRAPAPQPQWECAAMKSSPRSLQVEKVQAKAVKTQCRAKNKNNYLINFFKKEGRKWKAKEYQWSLILPLDNNNFLEVSLVDWSLYLINQIYGSATQK